MARLERLQKGEVCTPGHEVWANLLHGDTVLVLPR